MQPRSSESLSLPQEGGRPKSPFWSRNPVEGQVLRSLSRSASEPLPLSGSRSPSSAIRGRSSSDPAENPVSAGKQEVKPRTRGRPPAKRIAIAPETVPATVELEPLQPQDMVTMGELHQKFSRSAFFDVSLSKLAARCLVAAMQVLTVDPDRTVKQISMIRERSFYFAIASRVTVPQQLASKNELESLYPSLLSRYNFSEFPQVVSLRNGLKLAPATGHIMVSGISEPAPCSEVIHTLVSVFLASIGANVLEKYSAVQGSQSRYVYELDESSSVRVDFGHSTVNIKHAPEPVQARTFAFNDLLWNLIRYYASLH
jgi:hypothetical protein